jgi:hypothetical protein
LSDAQRAARDAAERAAFAVKQRAAHAEGIKWEQRLAALCPPAAPPPTAHPHPVRLFCAWTPRPPPGGFNPRPRCPILARFLPI